MPSYDTALSLGLGRDYDAFETAMSGAMPAISAGSAPWWRIWPARSAPVWLLLHHASDWRWMPHTDRSPWYPTIRLFRQAAPGQWRPVVDSVARKLALTAR